jgi:hypothetical protein
MATPGLADQSSASTYKYSQLSSPKATRLVKLLPGASSDEIKCHLTEHIFEDLPPYEALSYTWGDSTKAHTISMNDTLFGTTENVRSFLERYRHETESRYLWIDSICNNQSDEDEKTAQVKMMGDIYQQATRVVVWLGNSENAKAAIDLVKKLASSFAAIDPFWICGAALAFGISVWKGMEPRLTDRGRENLNLLIQRTQNNLGNLYSAMPWTLIGRLARPRTWLKSLLWRPAEPKTISPDFFAMLQLLRHPWFERVWIIQEVVLAQTVTVLYGSEEIPWLTLSSFITALVMSFHGLPKWTSPLTQAETHLIRCCLPISMLHVCMMGEIRLTSFTGCKVTFDQLMRRFITCRATLPRDKIFALLALSDEAEWDKGPLAVWPCLPATADYRRSTTDRQVFISTARNMLLRESSPFKLPLFVLPFAGTGYGFRNIKGGLPSWVPDWSGRNATGSVITTLAYHFGGETLSYRASGPASDPYIYNSPSVREEIARTIIKHPLELLSLFGLPPDATTSPYVFPGPEYLPDSIKLEATVCIDTVAQITATPLKADFFDNEGTPFRDANGVKHLREVFEVAWKWQTETQNMVLAHARDPYPSKTPISREEAYVRTIVGDRTTTARPAPEPFYMKDGMMFQTQQAVLWARLKGQDLGADTEERVKSMWPDMWDGKMDEDGGLMMQFWVQNTWLLPFGVAFREICGGRKFCVMEGGRMGVVPPETRVGDQVRIVMGAQTPFVLRPAEGAGVGGDGQGTGEKCYELVGECYVHGMMDGEGVTDGYAAAEKIILV